jgi:hypothetical protein
VRARYGAGPLHLVGHLAAIAVVAVALSHLFGTRFAPDPVNLAAWLLLGAVAHDLVLLPAYAAADAAARRVMGPLVNYVRVPAIVALVLLLVYAPRILDRRPRAYEAALGHAPPDFLGRWLAITGGLFAASALVALVRASAAGRRRARAR